MDSYISDAVIRRLPRYRRYLKKLKDQGIQRISSKELGNIMDVTASQIRQDLNHFGGFGQQGYGYGVDDLRQKLEEIMGLNKTYNVGVVGMGQLGHAIVAYLKNNEPCYKIVALCDNRPEVTGQEIFGITVQDKQSFRQTMKKGLDILIITAPAYIADEVAGDIEGTEIKGIWNFGHTEFNIKGVKVVNVHLSDSLHALCYYINHPD